MSAPSILSPWFVVFDLVQAQDTDHENELVYYQSEYSKTPHKLSGDKSYAMIYHNLAAASRTAESEAAMVRVLTTKEEAKEFDRA